MRKLILGLLFAQCVAADPIVIAHRGASGYLPEHTLEATTLAFNLGADYIEQDLVLSKDLVPVVLHDIHLDTVTNVAQIFPERKRKDGRFYTFDFTLAELKTLKVNERTDLSGKQVFPERYKGSAEFTIATFEEHIELINELNRQFGKNVGLYPEIKSPKWHKTQGADISKIVFDILRKHDLDDADKAIYVQCFDFDETRRLRNELGAKVKLVQLIGENDWGESDSDYRYLQTPEGLNEINKVAQGISSWIPQLVNKTLSSDARKAGLLIHAYTVRKNEMKLLDILFKQVDGVFTDFPDKVKKHPNNTH